MSVLLGNDRKGAKNESMREYEMSARSAQRKKKGARRDNEMNKVLGDVSPTKRIGRPRFGRRERRRATRPFQER